MPCRLHTATPYGAALPRQSHLPAYATVPVTAPLPPPDRPRPTHPTPYRETHAGPVCDRPCLPCPPTCISRSIPDVEPPPAQTRNRAVLQPHPPPCAPRASHELSHGRAVSVPKELSTCRFSGYTAIYTLWCVPPFARRGAVFVSPGPCDAGTRKLRGTKTEGSAIRYTCTAHGSRRHGRPPAPGDPGHPPPAQTTVSARRPAAPAAVPRGVRAAVAGPRSAHRGARARAGPGRQSSHALCICQRL